MAQLREKQDSVDAFWTDHWNGYPANRARLLQHVHDSKVSNSRSVASGDIHSFFANDLKLDFDSHQRPRQSSPPNSSGPRSRPTGRLTTRSRRCCRQNPHVHFFESRRRGYVCVDLQREKMQVRMRAVSDAHDPQATIATSQTYAVESGHPGVTEA